MSGLPSRPAAGLPPLGQQIASYGVFGAIQLLIDWAVFVALSALGGGVVMANVTGRVAGAVFGYWANGRWTFRDHSGRHRISGQSMRRFLLLWGAMAALSTFAVSQIDAALGLHWAWIGKPVVDLGLAVLAFVVSRRWVYR